MPKDKGFKFRASALSRLSVKLLNSEALTTDEFPIPEIILKEPLNLTKLFQKYYENPKPVPLSPHPIPGILREP